MRAGVVHASRQGRHRIRVRVAQPLAASCCVVHAVGVGCGSVCDCVGAGDDEKVCGDVGGGFGVDHDGDDDSAADNVFAAAAVGFDVNVSAATAAAATAAAAVAADVAAATHRLMRCRLLSRRDNAVRLGVSTSGCGVWG